MTRHDNTGFVSTYGRTLSHLKVTAQIRLEDATTASFTSPKHVGRMAGFSFRSNERIHDELSEAHRLHLATKADRDDAHDAYMETLATLEEVEAAMPR